MHSNNQTMEEAQKQQSDDGSLKCHILPCKVDYSGRVPGAQHFFQPTPIPEDPATDAGSSSSSSTNGITTTKHDGTTEGTLLAATLRGRGLLGRETTVSTNDFQANLRVLKVNCTSIGSTDHHGWLQVDGPPVEKIIQWEHEHAPEALRHKKGGSMSNARAWCQVAQALHAPVPTTETF